VTKEQPDSSSIVDDKYDWKWKGPVLFVQGKLQYELHSQCSSTGIARFITKYIYGRHYETTTDPTKQNAPDEGMPAQDCLKKHFLEERKNFSGPESSERYFGYLDGNRNG